MSATESMDSLKELFPRVTAKQWLLLERWAVLLRDWNTRINLVSRKDIDTLESKHLAHSLAATRFLRLMDGARVLDVGTGGGLPGLPLAICYPGARFTLVDSIGKKIHAVTNIITELGLKNVEAKQARAETLTREYDFITGRSVADLGMFLGWVRKQVRRGRVHSPANGVLYWTGGEQESVYERIGVHPRNVYPLADFLADPWFETKQIVHFDARDFPRLRIAET